MWESLGEGQEGPKTEWGEQPSPTRNTGHIAARRQLSLGELATLLFLQPDVITNSGVADQQMIKASAARRVGTRRDRHDGEVPCAAAVVFRALKARSGATRPSRFRRWGPHPPGDVSRLGQSQASE